MQQFGMPTTVEWLVEKGKGGTIGFRNAQSLQLSKQHALCKMVYSVEEHMFIVKTFYQSSSFNTRVYPKVSGLAAWSKNCNGTALCH